MKKIILVVAGTFVAANSFASDCVTYSLKPESSRDFFSIIDLQNILNTKTDPKSQLASYSRFTPAQESTDSYAGCAEKVYTSDSVFYLAASYSIGIPPSNQVQQRICEYTGNTLGRSIMAACSP